MNQVIQITIICMINISIGYCYFITAYPRIDTNQQQQFIPMMYQFQRDGNNYIMYRPPVNTQPIYYTTSSSELINKYKYDHDHDDDDEDDEEEEDDDIQDYEKDDDKKHYADSYNKNTVHYGYMKVMPAVISYKPTQEEKKHGYVVENNFKSQGAHGWKSSGTLDDNEWKSPASNHENENNNNLEHNNGWKNNNNGWNKNNNNGLLKPNNNNGLLKPNNNNNGWKLPAATGMTQANTKWQTPIQDSKAKPLPYVHKVLENQKSVTTLHGYTSSATNHKEQHDQHHHEGGSAPYEFEYFVKDPHTHDIKNQKETSDGHVVTGSYSLIQPDGKLRTVEYTADWKNGFQAKVHYSDAPEINPHEHPSSFSNFNLGQHHH